MYCVPLRKIATLMRGMAEGMKSVVAVLFILVGSTFRGMCRLLYANMLQLLLQLRLACARAP